MVPSIFGLKGTVLCGEMLLNLADGLPKGDVADWLARAGDADWVCEVAGVFEDPHEVISVKADNPVMVARIFLLTTGVLGMFRTSCQSPVLVELSRSLAASAGLKSRPPAVLPR